MEEVVPVQTVAQEEDRPTSEPFEVFVRVVVIFDGGVGSTRCTRLADGVLDERLSSPHAEHELLHQSWWPRADRTIRSTTAWCPCGEERVRLVVRECPRQRERVRRWPRWERRVLIREPDPSGGMPDGQRAGGTRVSIWSD